MENDSHLVPKHIAIVMDGNRRWAKEHNLHVLEGHRRVLDVVLEPLIEHAADLGVETLTFWAWSTENWRRSEAEVKGIMDLFRHIIRRRWQRLHEKGVRIKTIGDISKFPEDIRKSIDEVVIQTEKNTRITTVFGLNYGGRDEMVRAIRRISEERLTGEVDEKMISGHLDTAGIPDPEMIVRPGGEERLSGFLLWQSEYSELYFPKWYMPDFSPEKLDEVVEEFRKRSRRFGK